jgi:uncharacterized membrane protein (UPF0127 family)
VGFSVSNYKLQITNYKFLGVVMPPRGPKGYAFNRTRTTYLATDLLIARTHWSRFRGLMATHSSHFSHGQGLWINPSHGIHTFAMRFPIDAVYLDRERIVIHIEEELKPWRMGTVRESLTALGDQVDISFEERPVHTEAA